MYGNVDVLCVVITLYNNVPNEEKFNNNDAVANNSYFPIYIIKYFIIKYFIIKYYVCIITPTEKKNETKL